MKTWYTFNEPHVYCDQLPTYPFSMLFNILGEIESLRRNSAKIASTLAPGVNSSTAFFQCAYNLCRFFSLTFGYLVNKLLTVKAHAGAVKAFRAMNISGEIAYKNDGAVYVYDLSIHLFSPPQVANLLLGVRHGAQTPLRTPRLPKGARSSESECSLNQFMDLETGQSLSSRLSRNRSCHV